MMANKPAVLCLTDPTKIVEGLNANSVSEVIKWRSEAQRRGGLDTVIKCLIAKTIDQFS